MKPNLHLASGNPHLNPLLWLLFSASALLMIGVIMISSASMDVAAETLGNGFYYVTRQVIYAAIGLALGLAVANVPVSWWQRSGWLLLAIAMVLLVLVLTPLGREVNGATRWLPMGIFNIQVSEVAKLFLVAYVAGYVDRRRDELVSTWSGFLKPLMVIGVASVLLLMEPDFGATVVLAAASLGMIFLSGVSLVRLIPLVAIAGVLAALLVYLEPYRMARMQSFLNPWADPFDKGYQLVQSLIAFGRGDWFGVGLGNSIQKLFYLPEAHTDFIFAIIAEEFGLFGALSVLALFMVLVLSGLVISRRAEQSGMGFAGCFGYGLTLIIGLQAVVNMGVSTGLLPTKGLTLPLVSYGGSSMLVTCIALGILIRIEMERMDRAATAAEEEKPSRQQRSRTIPRARPAAVGATYD